MTVKGPRSRSLRRMEKAESEAFRGGGAFDTEIPEPKIDQILLEEGMQFDYESFKEFMRYRVGQYRSVVRDYDAELSISEELKLLDEAVNIILELKTRIKNFTPSTSAYLRHIELERHGQTRFWRQLDTELQEAWTMIALAERKVEPYKDMKGSKHKSNRDSFLSDILGWLQSHHTGLTQKRACKVLYQLCIVLEIMEPTKTFDESPTEMMKIIRAWRKKIIGK